MADPGVPRRIAVAIADDLAEDLGRELGGRWRVEVDQETLPLGPEGEIRLTEHAPRLHRLKTVLELQDAVARLITEALEELSRAGALRPRD